MNRMASFICVTVMAAVAGSLGCKPAPPKPTAASASAAALPATLFVSSAPAEARDVKAARETASKGDRVVLRGRIGGAVNPFVDERAVFTLIDLALPTCADNPDDGCKTPWDYCCERREDIRANAATIQVVGPTASGAGADHQPLKVGLRDVNGLKPMAQVEVVGTVVEADPSGLFTVNAESIYVAGK